MKVYYCERCGAEIKSSFVGNVRPFYGVIKSTKILTIKYLDLCKDCTASLTDWWFRAGDDGRK